MEKMKNTYIYRFCIILTICLVCITLCSCKVKAASYSDIARITYKEILNQKADKNGRYLVAIYSTTCTYCEELEPTVVKYYNFTESKKFFNYKYPPIYVLNINAVENKGIKASDSEYDVFIGTSNYQDIKFATAPALIEITDGKVTDLISSKVENLVVTAVEVKLNKLMN